MTGAYMCSYMFLYLSKHKVMSGMSLRLSVNLQLMKRINHREMRALGWLRIGYIKCEIDSWLILATIFFLLVCELLSLIERSGTHIPFSISWIKNRNLYVFEAPVLTPRITF